MGSHALQTPLGVVVKIFQFIALLGGILYKEAFGRLVKTFIEMGGATQANVEEAKDGGVGKPTMEVMRL